DPSAAGTGGALVMREIATVRDDGMQWMDADGPFADIVLSTRIRLARNLREFRFGIRSDAVERRDILSLAREAAAETGVLGDGAVMVMGDLGVTDRKLLLERHMVSRELVGDDGAAPAVHSALLLADREGI